MKKIKSLSGIFFLFMALVFIAQSCTFPGTLIFAEREWNISNHYGQIIDRDSTFRFMFGNVLIPDPLVIISSKDSLKQYPGMDKFLADILHTAHLDNAEILFYAPEMQTMVVKTAPDMPPSRPSSISSPLSDENPYTAWIYEDDIEKWERKSEEMFTYTYFDKRKKQLLIVDCFDYGDTPVAQISINQNRNKSTNKMNLPAPIIRAAFHVRPDLSKYMNYVEPIANWVEVRRGRAIGNYKIGQEQKLKRDQ